MALLAVLGLLGAGALFGIVAWLNAQSDVRARERETIARLAQAKEALIAFVSGRGEFSTSAGGPWPGDLPCPDIDNDGDAEASCSGNALGRLPWRTLGLPDPALGNANDPAGLRLWYAVSANYRNNPRCTAPCRNSDTPGTILVRDAGGTPLYQGSQAAVAVVLSPGPVLQRLDGLQQSRAAANVNAPAHYLDAIAGEDNAGFVDGGSDGFFMGPVSAGGRTIANDQVAVVTREEADRAMRRRVAAEVARCLRDYLQRFNRLPWLAPPNDTAQYSDTVGRIFGRFPLQMDDTNAANSGLPVNWGYVGSPCAILGTGTQWWQNWREQVFVAIDAACAPTGSGCASPPASPPLVPCSLSVNGAPGRCFAVIVAGKALAGQSRTPPGNVQVVNYLEGDNVDGVSPFSTCEAANCNDLVVAGP